MADVRWPNESPLANGCTLESWSNFIVANVWTSADFTTNSSVTYTLERWYYIDLNMYKIHNINTIPEYSYVLIPWARGEWEVGSHNHCQRNLKQKDQSRWCEINLQYHLLSIWSSLMDAISLWHCLYKSRKLVLLQDTWSHYRHFNPCMAILFSLFANHLMRKTS